MRAVKRKPKRAAFGIRDKVNTGRGEGAIKYVFPAGPHGKYTYTVGFYDRRVGEVFSEDEITLIEKCGSSKSESL